MTDTWSYTFDFKQSNGTWSVYAGNPPNYWIQAQYETNRGWVCDPDTANNGYPGRITITYLFPFQVSLTKVVVERDGTLPSSTIGHNVVAISYYSTTTLLTDIDVEPADPPSLITTHPINVNQPLRGIALDVRSGVNRPGGLIQCAVTRLTLYGTGANPRLDHYCSACAANYIGTDLDESND